MFPAISRSALRGLSSGRSLAVVASRSFAAEAAKKQQGQNNQQKQQQQQQQQRQEPPKTSSLGGVFVGALVGAGSYYFFEQNKDKFLPPVAPKHDVANVAKDIVALLDDPEYDDGSRGPLFVRLAWHCAGTYDKHTNTGGSNGATMRFREESNHGANAGLYLARALLEGVKQKHPWISYADLYTLAGVVAVKELGGPSIEWRSGRSDAPNRNVVPPEGRLPDAAQGAAHIRNVFYRMGLNDQEIVALAGAHALGRCHTDRSGFSGPWTRSPTSFTNAYFTELLNNKWTKKNWSGPVQFEDPTKELMMLPADLAFVQDSDFKQWVVKYAEDDELFFKDFSAAFKKLLELGVPFSANSTTYKP